MRSVSRQTNPAAMQSSPVNTTTRKPSRGRYHDEVTDQGCGRSLLRLSTRRLHDAEVEAALGELAGRAAGVSILWNENEGEIIRVLEVAAPRLAA